MFRTKAMAQAAYESESKKNMVLNFVLQALLNGCVEYEYTSGGVTVRVTSSPAGHSEQVIVTERAGKSVWHAAYDADEWLTKMRRERFQDDDNLRNAYNAVREYLKIPESHIPAA